MDIKQLKYYVTVVDMSSFSRAAEHLFISQSALSRVIGNLEREYGVQLIYFQGKQMQLTRFGTQLYTMAQNLIYQYDAINEAMHGLPARKKGILRIGLSRIGGPSVFPDLGASFLEKHPDVEFVIEQHAWLHDIENMVNNHQLDAGFVLGPVSTDAFDVMPVHKSHYVIVTSTKHPLAERETLRFSDLCEERFIMLSREFRICQEFLAGCRMAGFEPHMIAHLVHWDLICKLVKRNMGITFLVQALLDAFPDEGLKSIPIVDALTEWDVVMITAKNRYESAPLKLFKDHIQEMAGGDEST